MRMAGRRGIQDPASARLAPWPLWPHGNTCKFEDLRGAQHVPELYFQRFARHPGDHRVHLHRPHADHDVIGDRIAMMT
jgi:hypothetical protein